MIEGVTKQVEKLEVQKTEFVDKQLPSIYYEKVDQTEMSKATSTIIRVTDTTIDGALRAFNEVREKVKDG